MKLDLRKLQHVAGLALKNGIRLHFDSINLYNLKSYNTALFISVIAMEEIGKAFWSDHFVFHSRVDGRYDEDFEKEWINHLFGDHKGKQLSFIYQIFRKIDKKYIAYVQSKQLDKLKQDSIYVGLEKTAKGYPRTDGKIINPSKHDIIKTKEQILLIHNFLESEIEDINKGMIYHDLAVFRNILNSELLEKLKIEKIK
jgi:AbiV family abortive infection protein